jgi:integrase
MDLHVDPTQILTPDEVHLVLMDGERRAKRFPLTRQNLVIFRLAACCGLRSSEIAGLRLRDLRTDSDVPVILVGQASGKGAKARKVPLAWDEGTWLALRAWKAIRLISYGAAPSEPVVCVLVDHPQYATSCIVPTENRSHVGRALLPIQVYRKFKAALRPLPPERRAQLHTHSGRHTFASYAVRSHPLAAVRDALGHASIATTSVYLHMAAADFAKKGNIYGFASVPGMKTPPETAPDPT